MERILCPLISIATSSGTPARIQIANGLLLETTVVDEAALFTVCVIEPLLPV